MTLVDDMVSYQVFDVFHNLRIALVGGAGHLGYCWLVCIMDICRLGEKNEGHC